MIDVFDEINKQFSHELINKPELLASRIMFKLIAFRQDNNFSPTCPLLYLANNREGQYLKGHEQLNNFHGHSGSVDTPWENGAGRNLDQHNNLGSSCPKHDLKYPYGLYAYSLNSVQNTARSVQATVVNR